MVINEAKKAIVLNLMNELMIVAIVFLFVIPVVIYSHHSDPTIIDEKIQDELYVQIPNPIPMCFNNNSQVDQYFSGNSSDGLSIASAYTVKDKILTSVVISSGHSSLHYPIISNSSRFIIFENCTFTSNGVSNYISFVRSANLLFNNSKFISYSLRMYVTSCFNTTFNNCQILAGWTSISISCIESSTNVNISRCKIQGIRASIINTNDSYITTTIFRHWEVGLYLRDSQNNRILENYFDQNLCALKIYGDTRNNLIAQNFFKSYQDNVVFGDSQAEQANNSWTYEGMGNYWNNYLTQQPFSMARDGIYSKSFSIGAGGQVDPFPLARVPAMWNDEPNVWAGTIVYHQISLPGLGILIGILIWGKIKLGKKLSKKLGKKDGQE